MSRPNGNHVALIKSSARECLAPLDEWSKRCHEASIALVQSNRFRGARVARGWCKGVGIAQHSWVTLGDPYTEGVVIIDPTLWSYDTLVNGVYVSAVGGPRDRHTPHGSGDIFTWGRPAEPTGPVVELKPKKPWSKGARIFLDLMGPLDAEGWRVLAQAPVQGWPSSEIIEAMYHNGYAAYIPVDIIGMVTEINPGGLYPRTPS